MSEPNIRQRVDALIVENRSILVCRTPNGFDYPGGGVDEGESIIEAAVRECMEESGFRLIEPKLITLPQRYMADVQSDPFLRDNGYTHEVYYSVYGRNGGFNDRLYDIEGDAGIYFYVPIKTLRENFEALRAYSRGNDRRAVMLAHRCDVLDALTRLLP